MPRKHSILYLALLLLAGCCSAAPRTTIVVEAHYPGANAQTVADTIAAPIEEQVNGVEKALYLRSCSFNDGRYVLTVEFADGMDSAMAQVLVQNRVALALRVLPLSVQDAGVTVKKAPGNLQFIAALSSPKATYDTQWLSNYAAVNLKDELNRTEGVGEVRLFPQPDGDGMRVSLDGDKLAKTGLTAADVVRALQAQNFQVAKAPPIGNNQTRLDVTNQRLLEPEEVGKVILKAAAGGDVVRLHDVARIERHSDRRYDFARLNRKDVALLFIAPTATARLPAVKDSLAPRLAALAKQFPDDMHLELAFDFTANLQNPGQRTAPEYLLVDVAPPPALAAPEGRFAILRRCETLLAKVDGVQDVLALSDNPFDPVHPLPCILLRLAPPGERKTTRDEVATTVRAQLHEKVPEAAARFRLPLGAAPFTGWSYPLDMAIHGPEMPEVRKFAAKLAERLRQDKQLTDVWLDPAGDPQRQLFLDVNRDKAVKRKVPIEDIFEALNSVGKAGDIEKDLGRLKVRNRDGAMVPLAEMVTIHETKGPAAVDRFDQQPMAEITANPASGVALAAARARCEKLARAVRTELDLPAEYRLSWLR